MKAREKRNKRSIQLLQKTATEKARLYRKSGHEEEGERKRGHLVDVHDFRTNLRLLRDVIKRGVGASVEPHQLRHRQPAKHQHQDQQLVQQEAAIIYLSKHAY